MKQMKCHWPRNVERHRVISSGWRRFTHYTTITDVIPLHLYSILVNLGPDAPSQLDEAIITFDVQFKATSTSNNSIDLLMQLSRRLKPFVETVVPPLMPAKVVPHSRSVASGHHLDTVTSSSIALDASNIKQYQAQNTQFSIVIILYHCFVGSRITRVLRVEKHV